jgi:hypothetical protein
MASKANSTTEAAEESAPIVTATYRALQNGYLSNEGRYIFAGEIFTATIPKGDWMEVVEQAPAADSAGQADA